MADLTTTAAVKTFGGITGSGDDVTIDGIVSAVSALLHSLVGNDFDGTPVVAEHHSSAASGAIILRQQAATIQAVREGGTTLDASAYELAGGQRLYRLANGVAADWARGFRNIEVDYTPPTTIPADLELAARTAATFIVKQGGFAAGSGRLGLGSQTNTDAGTADYLIQQIRDLPLVASAVKRYRLLA